MSETATTFTSGNEQVVALAKMISETTDKIIKIYSATGHRIPSLESTVGGPFDSASTIPSELSRELQILEAACGQLNATINTPSHLMTSRAYAYEEPACLQLITSTKVADYLLNKPEGLHVNELAEKTGIDASKLGRILRFLATKHCFREVKPNVFTNNRLSMQLISTNPVSGLIGHMTDEGLKAGAYLSDTLRDPKLSGSLSPDDAAFRKARGMSIFQFLETPEGKAVGGRFAQAMVGWGEVTGKSRLPSAYPWESVAEGSIICDVGGGNGHVSLELAKAFPNLRIIIQDLPPTIIQAEQYWNEEYPEAVQQQQVEFIPMDFFKESPAPNCQIYYLRHVLHDWPIAECIPILTNIRKVMTSSSRLLINELVLQHTLRDISNDKSIDQAPEPLLANYGMGRARLYEQDLNMMIQANSQERSLQEFIDLGAQAGFKFEKLWDAGTTSLVEFSIA